MGKEPEQKIRLEIRIRINPQDMGRSSPRFLRRHYNQIPIMVNITALRFLSDGVNPMLGAIPAHLFDAIPGLLLAVPVKGNPYDYR